MSSVPPPLQASEPTPPELEPLRGPDDRPRPEWAAWMAPSAIILGLGIGILADIVLEVISGTSASNANNPGPGLNLALNAVFDLSFVSAAVYFARTRGRLRPADFGYRRPPWWPAVGAVVVGAIAYYVVTYVYQLIFTLHGSDKLPSAFGHVKTSTSAMLCAAAFVCVIAPIAEEFFFRGFLFGVLRGWRGPWVAAVIVAVLFGAVHAGSAPIEDLIPLGFFGFVLCLVRWRTDSLYPGMALHSLNNALALGITDLGWGLGNILLLIVGATAVIAAVTLPLSLPSALSSAPSN